MGEGGEWGLRGWGVLQVGTDEVQIEANSSELPSA